MSVSEAFREQIRDLLADLGSIRFKAMFGGAGLYAGDLFFAIAADDVAARSHRGLHLVKKLVLSSLI